MHSVLFVHRPYVMRGVKACLHRVPAWYQLHTVCKALTHLPVLLPTYVATASWLSTYWLLVSSVCQTGLPTFSSCLPKTSRLQSAPCKSDLRFKSHLTHLHHSRSGLLQVFLMNFTQRPRISLNRGLSVLERPHPATDRNTVFIS